MDVTASSIPGCLELRPKVAADARGGFVKFFQRSAWSELGLSVDFTEQYYSTSHRNVIRGLHFQTPPAQHDKAVFCVSGRAFDVALDLRKGSPTFGKHHACMLEGGKANGLYVPQGLAHGFAALEDNTVLLYLVTSEYAARQDSGVRWDSAGINWPVKRPILSSRDQGFAPMDAFESPFRYRA